MTPSQELANALTMLLPGLFLMRAGNVYDTQLLRTAVLFHMPFSTAYHMGCCLRIFESSIDNSMRKMDQTMQHISSVIISYITSRHSVAYCCLVCIPLSAHGIYRIWTNQPRCWVHVSFSMLLYMIPLIWPVSGEMSESSVAVFLTALLSCIFFCMGGWGHSIFHVFIAAHSLAIASLNHERHEKKNSWNVYDGQHQSLMY